MQGKDKEEPEVIMDGSWFSMSAEEIAKEWMNDGDGQLPAQAHLQKVLLQIVEESFLLEEGGRREREQGN